MDFGPTAMGEMDLRLEEKHKSEKSGWNQVHTGRTQRKTNQEQHWKEFGVVSSTCITSKAGQLVSYFVAPRVVENPRGLASARSRCGMQDHQEACN